MGKPTPGPWKAQFKTESEFDRRTGLRIESILASVVSEREIIYAVSNLVNKDCRENATLIAQAPRMFENLREVLSMLTDKAIDEDEKEELIAKIEGTIFKITGECGCDGAPDGGGACFYHRSDEGQDR